MTTEMIERILSKENLEEAKCKVMSNKGSAGVDRMKTSELPKFIEAHGEELCEAIRRRKYKPLPVRRVEIPKEDGSKRNLGVRAVSYTHLTLPTKRIVEARETWECRQSKIGG